MGVLESLVVGEEEPTAPVQTLHGELHGGIRNYRDPEAGQGKQDVLPQDCNRRQPHIG